MTKITIPPARELGAHVKAAFMATAVLLAPSSTQAQAPTEAPYATGTDKPFTLSFDRNGRLYVGQFGEDIVWRVPAGGGAAAVFVTGTPGFGLGGIIGPDDALYVPNIDGEIYRYAPDAATPDSQPYATGFGSLPNGLAFDDAGRLYGVSTGTPRKISSVAPGGGAAAAVCVLPTESYAIIVSAAGKPLAISEQSGVIYQCDGNNVTVFANGISGSNVSLTKDDAGNIYYALLNGPNFGEIYRVPPGGRGVDTCHQIANRRFRPDLQERGSICGKLFFWCGFAFCKPGAASCASPCSDDVGVGDDPAGRDPGRIRSARH